MIRVVNKRSFMALVVLAFLLMALYYANRGTNTQEREDPAMGKPLPNRNQAINPIISRKKLPIKAKKECPIKEMTRSEVDIETMDVMPTLNFDADWMDLREYWNDKMENR